MAKKKNFSKTLKKTWDFIWKDNSVWSWIVNIILAFLIIKFLLYPGIGLAMSCNRPVVAVVSGSMEHNGNFNEWWTTPIFYNGYSYSQQDFYFKYNLTYENFSKFSFKNGFNKGDIMFIVGVKPKDVKIGDVIVYNQRLPDPIIHRVIKIDKINGSYYFTTKGDHNPDLLRTNLVNEEDVPQNLLVGKASFRIPWLGWVKIGFVEFIKLFVR